MSVIFNYNSVSDISAFWNVFFMNLSYLAIYFIFIPHILDKILWKRNFMSNSLSQCTAESFNIIHRIYYFKRWKAKYL